MSTQLVSTVHDALIPLIEANGLRHVGGTATKAVHFARGDGLAIDLEPRGSRHVCVWIPASLVTGTLPHFAELYEEFDTRNHKLSAALGMGTRALLLRVTRVNLPIVMRLVQRLIDRTMPASADVQQSATS